MLFMENFSGKVALFFIFRHIYSMKGKSSTQNTQSERFFYVYLPIVRTECPDSEFESFLSPNWRKFAIECDWNSKISQIRTKSFFEKKLGSQVFSQLFSQLFSQVFNKYYNFIRILQQFFTFWWWDFFKFRILQLCKIVQVASIRKTTDAATDDFAPYLWGWQKISFEKVDIYFCKTMVS